MKNAPRTQIGSVLGTKGEQIEVPIKLMDDCDICSIDLSISFRTKNDGLACLKFLRWKNVDINGMLVNVVPTPNNPNRQTMKLAWYSQEGGNVHFEKGTILAIAVFEYVSGDGNVIFVNYDGTPAQGDFKTCEYGYYDADDKTSYALNDFPTEEYYLGGQFHELQEVL